MAFPDYFRIYLETIKGRNGCLTVGKNIDVSTCVDVFYIVHSTGCNDVYFSL